MKKKIFSAFLKSSEVVVIVSLLLILCLNMSTLRSVHEINQGELIKSGYFCAIVGSGSMEPAVFVNDLLLVRGGEDYRVDDIITYVSKKGTLITHRIKEVGNGSYITQGDANNTPDEEVSRRRVLGKVVFILPGAGKVIAAAVSPAGMLLLGCVGLFLLVLQRIR